MTECYQSTDSCEKASKFDIARLRWICRFLLRVSSDHTYVGETPTVHSFAATLGSDECGEVEARANSDRDVPPNKNFLSSHKVKEARGKQTDKALVYPSISPQIAVGAIAAYLSE